MNSIMSTATFLFVLAMAAPAHAQQNADPRWAPWLGCWQLVDETQRDANPDATEVRGTPVARPSTRAVSVCVAPAPEPAGITLQTLVSNQPVLDQTIVADGAGRPITDPDCRGTERAEWSRTGTRLFANALLVCGDQMMRKISGLAMIAGSGIWVDVQVVETGGRESIRVRRYRRAPDQRGVAEVSRIGAPLTIDDVKEASGKVSPDAVEAALIATNARFDLNSRRLIDLADADVPDTVIDLMVALSYPRHFVVERATGGGTPSFFNPLSAVYPYPPYTYGDPYNEYLYDAYYYSPFAYSYLGRYGTAYLPGVAGFVAVDGAGTRTPDNGGQVINGVGYARVRPRETSEDNTSSAARQGGRASTSGSDPTSSGGSYGGGSSGVATSGGFSSGSSSGDSGRTAEPR